MREINDSLTKEDGMRSLREWSLRTSPPEKDFSDAVMDGIAQTGLRPAKRRALPVRRRTAGAAAAVTAAALLAAGMAVAASSAGWPFIHDGSGSPVLRVEPYYSVPQNELQRQQSAFLDKLLARLKPAGGQTIGLLYGKAQIAEYRSGARTYQGHPYVTGMSSTGNQLEFDRIEELLGYPDVPYRAGDFPRADADGYVLESIKAFPVDPAHTFNAADWSEGIDEATGEPYAYYLTPPYTGGNVLVDLTYRKDRSSFTVTMSAAETDKASPVYDDHPSADHVYELGGGIQGYLSGGSGTTSLRWAKRTHPQLAILYTMNSSTLEGPELAAAASALLAAR